MSVTSTTNRKSYAGDAVTTSFATNPVVFFDSSDLAVSVVSAAGVETALTENTHYTVTGGDGSTGTVNLAGGSAPYGAPAVGVTLLILRVVALTQPVDFVQNDGSDAEVQETAYDRLTMMVQQLNEVDARAIKLPPVETGSTALTELPFDRASKFLAFDASKNLIAAAGTTGVPVSAFMETVLDDTTAAAARTTLGAAGTVESAAALVAALEKTIPRCGRLTLTTGVPVTSSDVTGATNVYFTPYKGNVVALYDGTDWVPTVFTELSQTTADNTKSPAAVANNSNYDIFVWNDAGTLRATRGPAWTSDTARGTGAGTTELEVLEGRYVNKIAITNGPAAQRGLYVGTVRSDGSAQINDQLGGIGGTARRHVWNYFNRVERDLFCGDSTDTWTYATDSWRAANNNAANSVSYVCGVVEEPITAKYMAQMITAAASAGSVGVGVDSSTVNSAQVFPELQPLESSHVTAFYEGVPAGVGLHTIYAIERVRAAGTVIFSGDNGLPNNSQYGLQVKVKA